VLSSLTVEPVDWSQDVSKSPSLEFESARWRPSATGAADEERGGGVEVASLMVEDIHNMPMPRMV
jgi:hypothetical protein